MEPSDQVTRLLGASAAGDSRATAELLPLVYDALRALAGSFFGSPNPSHTLQPTALVHEAYVKLAKAPHQQWTGRRHFFEVAAKAMRQILVNHARDKRAQKRGGGASRVALDSDLAHRADGGVDILALEDALADLERHYPQQCRIVELRFFGGMNMEEIAAVLGLSLRTLQREWRMARAELKLRLREGGGAPP